jgi:hypothetical protein
LHLSRNELAQKAKDEFVLKDFVYQKMCGMAMAMNYLIADFPPFEDVFGPFSPLFLIK